MLPWKPHRLCNAQWQRGLASVPKFPITAAWRGPYKAARAILLNCMESPSRRRHTVTPIPPSPVLSTEGSEPATSAQQLERLWEAHSCLPALPRCSALFRLSLSSPQKNNSALLCHPVRRFNTSNGQLPKGTWKRGDENHRVLFWNYRPQQLVALCKRGSPTGSSLCYRGWTGMEMLRVQE